MSDVTDVTHVSAIDGHASLFTNYEDKVTLRGQIAALDPQKRAASLILHTTDIARKACGSAAKGDVGNADGVAHILRERFPPAAIDSISQDVAKFM